MVSQQTCVDRAPVQQRSRESTNRMLDAALRILERDGLAGFTIGAVSKEAGVGVGTIYHRFGDRMGLVIAAEDRFLCRLEEQWEAINSDVLHQLDNEQFVHLWLEGSLLSFVEYRNTYRAFMVTFHDHPELRDRGIRSSRRIGEFIVAALVERFGCSVRAADTAFRMAFADGTVDAMFSADEVTPHPVPLQDRVGYLKTAVLAVLTCDAQPEKSTTSRGGPSSADTRNGTALRSPTAHVSTASKSPAAATSVMTAVALARTVDGPR